MAKAEDVEITRELLEAVAMAQLYREDPIIAIRQNISEKLNNSEMNILYKRILQQDNFQEIKADAIKLETETLVDDNVDTIMLYYNKLLKQAQFEKKYEVVTRILKEIRQLKAIENEQMKFEIVIKVEKPEVKDNE